MTGMLYKEVIIYLYCLDYDQSYLFSFHPWLLLPVLNHLLKEILVRETQSDLPQWQLVMESATRNKFLIFIT